jgi:two-component system, OmpR family, copper resistance phosphate regulon response regulator CusR
MAKILIADDEARLAAFIHKGLNQNGFKATIVEDGEQALQQLKQGGYDLLLLDLGLPIKDGWTVLKELQQQQELVPIIIVTALNDERTRLAALASGATDFVAKPFRFLDLLAKVRSHLGDPI